MPSPVFVSWQGIPCLTDGNAFRFSASMGLGGDRGHVLVPARRFSSLVIRPSVVSVFKQYTIPGKEIRDGTVARSAPASQQKYEPDTVGQREVKFAHSPSGTVGANELDCFGDLVMDDGERDPVVIPDVYLAPEGISEHLPSEFNIPDQHVGPVAQIPLVTLPFFWSDRGIAPSLVANIRREAKKDVIDYVRPQILGPEQFYPATLNPITGEPWTLGELLELLAESLPGTPKITRLPEGMSVVTPTGIEWSAGELALPLLVRLAEEYGLTGTYNIFDPGKIAFYFEGEGSVDVEASLVGLRRKTVTYSYPPQCAIVVGAPTLEEVVVRGPGGNGLIPAGRDQSGKIVPLVDALADISPRLTLYAAGKMVLQKPQEKLKMMMDLTLAGLEEGKRFLACFDDWAFKWYMVPIESRGLLPAQDLLSSSEALRSFSSTIKDAGFGEFQRVKPIVMATGYHDVGELPVPIPGTETSEAVDGLVAKVAAALAERTRLSHEAADALQPISKGAKLSEVTQRTDARKLNTKKIRDQTDIIDTAIYSILASGHVEAEVKLVQVLGVELQRLYSEVSKYPGSLEEFGKSIISSIDAISSKGRGKEFWEDISEYGGAR